MTEALLSSLRWVAQESAAGVQQPRTSVGSTWVDRVTRCRRARTTHTARSPRRSSRSTVSDSPSKDSHTLTVQLRPVYTYRLRPRLLQCHHHIYIGWQTGFWTQSVYQMVRHQWHNNKLWWRPTEMGTEMVQTFRFSFHVPSMSPFFVPFK